MNEDSNSEEGTDLQHVLVGQLIAHADFRIDFGTHIKNILEAECEDLENVNNLQEEDDSEKEDNLEKEEHFNNDLENGKGDLSKWLSRQNPPKCVEKWNKKDITDWIRSPTSLFELILVTKL